MYLLRTYNVAAQALGNLCLAPRNGRTPGSTVMMLECNPADPRMQWQMFDKGVDEGSDFGRFKFDQLCLDLEGGRSAANRNPQGVVMWNCNGQQNQLWAFGISKTVAH
jgi:hypothetical protein